MSSPARLLRFDDGLHLEGTILWLDAPRERDLSFLSHAALDTLPLHRKVLTSPATFRLLEGQLATDRALPCPFFRPFFLGELELELLPAGFLPGSAQLLITWRGTRILYAADIGMKPNRTAEAIRIHRCDVLVMSCALGDPAIRVPERGQVEGDLLRFVRESLADGRPPVLLSDRLGLAQELLRLLDEAGIPARSHRSIARHARAYVELGQRLPTGEQRGPLRPDEALVWPLALHASPTLHCLRPRPRLAVVGEQALLGDVAPGQPLPAGPRFPLTLQPDFAELLAYVKAAAPGRVLLHRGRVRAFRQALVERGYDVELVLPPEQMRIV